MEKTSVITKVVYDKPWEAPNKDIIHYHSITLENGDIGNVGVSEKFPLKIGTGAKITYTINGNKIKIISNETATPPPPAQEKQAPQKETKAPFPQKTYAKKLDDFLGYTFGYAKDLTVAQIQSGDKEAIKDPAQTTIDHAETIYAKIREMLKDDWQPTPKTQKTPGPKKPVK